MIRNLELLYFEGGRLDIINSIGSKAAISIKIGSKCWKDSYNPVVVAGYIDRPEYWLFRPAPLKGFGPVYRTVTLVNTSTVTIIPATALSF
jgi:hypothetical protein